VTNVALGVVRALDYVSIALVLGAQLFLRRRLPATLRGGPFERGVWRLLVTGLALGVVVSVLGVLLEAARDSGVSLWSLRWAAVSHVLTTRFGWVWAVRALLLVVSLAALRVGRSRALGVWLFLVGGYLAATPALSGHAAVQSPVWLFLPCDVAHVLAASVWVGGVACLVFALPAALRDVEGPARTRVLAELLGRFAPVAFGAVGVIAVTGVVQAAIEVRTINALTHSTYGELVVLKIGLLGLLVGLGAFNHERLLPTLRRLRDAGSPPAQTGVTLARTTRAELAAMACVFAAAAALVAHTPPVAARRKAPVAAARTTIPPAPIAGRVVAAAPLRRSASAMRRAG
jgi:copper transport protein